MSGDGGRVRDTLPASPLFVDTEFVRTEGALSPDDAAATPSEPVAALSSALLQAQIASPLTNTGAWDDHHDDDPARERLTGLVESLHRCAPRDYK